MATSGASGSNTRDSVMVEKSVPKNMGGDEAGLKKGDSVNQNNAAGEISGNLKFGDRVDGGKIFKGANSVTLENKKRRTNSVNVQWWRQFRLTGLYGEPNRARRQSTWDLIRHLSYQNPTPWCLIGDMNNVLSQADKRGG
ncbi:hypothetical protein POM88_034787 [Heracleum sosnowskyi]|uniref:Endonuclease/exonuclease/phosphatase family protein n=1 Tax=Heracleum sosnowskyi TaxID=360622 RepID=A0AAD8HM71_9APIA|nr:hypothetical protein POM88_034787 [Heracleum sosnowskyi]